NRVDALLEKAMANYAQEQRPENRRRLAAFDLPAEGTIVHLRLFPKTYDTNMAAQLHGSMLLSSALQQRYKDRDGRTRVEVRPPLFSDEPKQVLIDEIKTQYKDGKGAKAFCIDIYNHGVADGLCFAQKLTAADLTDVTRQFPDC